MRKTKKIILCLLLTCSLFACSESKLGSKDFQKYIDKMPSNLLSDADLVVTTLFDNPEQFGFKKVLSEHDYATKKEFEESVKKTKEYADKLEEFDYGKLNDEQKIIYDLLKDTFDDTEDSEDYYYLFTNYFDINKGIVSNLPLSLYFFEFKDKNDIDSYVNLLETTDETLMKYAKHEQLRQDKGYGLSKSYLDSIKKQVDTFVEGDQSYILEAAKQKLNNANYLNDSEKENYEIKIQEVFQKDFLKGYVDLSEAISKIDIKMKKDGTLNDYKKGKEYYTSLVQDATGFESIKETKKYLEMKKNEILQEAITFSQINPEVRDVDFSKINYTDLKSTNEILDYLKQKYVKDFPVLDKDITYHMEIVPKAMREIFKASAAYFLSPLDNLDASEKLVLNGEFKQSDYAVVAHEGFPGHMYQYNYTKQKGHHVLRELLANIGASEGWATYVQDYSSKWANDPIASSFVELNETYSYCVILLLDMEIHYDGISKDEACEKLMDEFKLSKEDAENQYQQLLESPAVFMPYYGNYLRILDLKEEYKDKVKKDGKKYKDYNFHKKMLDLGSLPYSILEKYMLK